MVVWGASSSGTESSEARSEKAQLRTHPMPTHLHHPPSPAIAWEEGMGGTAQEKPLDSSKLQLLRVRKEKATLGQCRCTSCGDRPVAGHPVSVTSTQSPHRANQSVKTGNWRSPSCHKGDRELG